jgi:predicted ATPase
MIIKKIEIEKFRMMRDIAFDLGEKITVIVGQNGTMKSTLLGMIGQPFSLVNSTVFGSERRIGGERFGSQFSDAFKLSPTHDIAGEHKWKLFLDESVYPKEVYEAVSIVRDRVKGGIRIWSTEGRSKGMGYIQLPVIFLSLKRLVPVGEEKKVTHDSIELSEKEREFFEKYHSKILSLFDALTDVELVESSNKNSLGAVTDLYDGLTNSAGQDNVGKILSAVLSFRRLKEKFPSDYKGGVLLIDEIDATMYPAAQEGLVQALYRFASDYNMQIVFTTHSEAVVKIVLGERYSTSTKVILLDRRDDSVVPHEGLSPREILAHLSVLPLPEHILNHKIKIYCEDDEARLFIKGLIPRGYGKQIEFVNASVGGDELVSLAQRCKIPEFTHNLVILDGDKKPPSRLKNFLVLPGGKSPEEIFFSFLRNLSEKDSFWDKSPAGYTKQVCFYDYGNMEPNNRVEYKDWFNKQKMYWGRGCYKLFKRWIAENPAETRMFRACFDVALDRLIKKRREI